MTLQAQPEPRFTVPHFSVEGASLIIHTTDDPNHVGPSDEIEENERGQRRWYKVEPLSSSISRNWREQIANELVHKFLFMDPGSKFDQIQIYGRGEPLTLCRAYQICIKRLS
jgi:hypothetical protein